MGAHISSCTSSCHRPSSPTDSTSSFLKVAPTRRVQIPSGNGHRVPNLKYSSSSSQTQSTTNTDVSDCASFTPLASPSASNCTIQKSSNISSSLWLSGEEECFSPSVDKLSPPTFTFTKTSFVDPYLEALTEPSKPPPLPPRALRWKQRHASGGSSTSGEGMHPSSDPGQIASDLANLPRIYPIKKNGVQVSDTHYWLIPPPKKYTLQGIQSRSCGRSPGDPYINVTEHNYSPEPSALNNNKEPAFHRLRRGRSENYKECLFNIHKGQILRLRKLIPSATETEAYLVLLGTNWNFEDAAQRLKEELLIKSGYTSNLQHSHFLLVKNHWSFEAALSEAASEHRQRILLQ